MTTLHTFLGEKGGPKEKLIKKNPDLYPWIRKYRPQTEKQVIGHREQFHTLKDFIKNYKKQKKRALLLYGPTGVGKTAAVYALAKDLDLEIIEINASDSRNKASIEATLGGSLKQQSLFFKQKLILVEEIDSLSGTKDRGGLQALMALMAKSTYPIILTMNNPWDYKYATVRNHSLLLEFKELPYTDIFTILKAIAHAEHIKAEEEALKALAHAAGGDARAAINDLQLLSVDGKLTQEEIKELSERNRTDSIIQALLKVLKTTDISIARYAFDNVNEDLDQIFLWMDANLPKEYTSPEDLQRAYEKLSRADVFSGRIRRWQHWRFLVYIHALISAGVAVSKNEKYKHFIAYTPTGRLLKMWHAKMRYMKRTSIAEKLAGYTHTSTKRSLQDTLPYLKPIFKKNRVQAEALADRLDLNDEESAWLREK